MKYVIEDYRNHWCLKFYLLSGAKMTSSTNCRRETVKLSNLLLKYELIVYYLELLVNIILQTFITNIKARAKNTLINSRNLLRVAWLEVPLKTSTQEQLSLQVQWHQYWWLFHPSPSWGKGVHDSHLARIAINNITYYSSIVSLLLERERDYKTCIELRFSSVDRVDKWDPSWCKRSMVSWGKK